MIDFILYIYIYTYVYILALTCQLNWQIGCGIDRYVGRIVYPDWYVESIDMWIRTFILIGMWDRPLRGRTRSSILLRCTCVWARSFILITPLKYSWSLPGSSTRIVLLIDPLKYSWSLLGSSTRIRTVLDQDRSPDWPLKVFLVVAWIKYQD